MANEYVLALLEGGAYVAQQVFGPTLDLTGQELKQRSVVGLEQIIDSAPSKTKNLDDGKAANLRVTRDVLWNGAITEDEVCAEYFGGMAWWALTGLAVTSFAFLGVNMFLAGLHSYGTL